MRAAKFGTHPPEMTYNWLGLKWLAAWAGATPLDLVWSDLVLVRRCSYVTDISREIDPDPEQRAAALDLAAETTAHKFTLGITLVYALCLCPLMVLRSVVSRAVPTLNDCLVRAERHLAAAFITAPADHYHLRDRLCRIAPLSGGTDPARAAGLRRSGKRQDRSVPLAPVLNILMKRAFPCEMHSYHLRIM